MGAADGDGGNEGAVAEGWGYIENLFEQTEMASAKAVIAVVNANIAIANPNSKGLEEAYLVVHEAASECYEPARELSSVAVSIKEDTSSKLARYIRGASDAASANRNIANEAEEYIIALEKRMKLKWPE